MSKFTDFKNKIKPAARLVAKKLNLEETEVKKYNVFTPAKLARDFEWTKVYNVDALLVGRRPVRRGSLAANDYAKAKKSSTVRVAVLIQSEYATAHELGNPLGKASASSLPDGLWIMDEKEMIRLDQVYVLFVVPQAGATDTESEKKRSDDAWRHTSLAAKLMPACTAIPVPVNCTESDLAELIEKATSKAFRGPGKPKKGKPKSKPKKPGKKP